MFFGSVCSGIEAASVAWRQIGWKASWLAEIEPFPSAVLGHHYPSVPNLGDMTKIADKVKASEVAAPDVLVGGTPCQAFSVAGMREGLADPRGELTIRYVELADAIDDVRRRRGEQPAIIVWENVPGVLSSKDNAFGCFLGALAGESCELQPPGRKWENAGAVFGPQRAVAWRVLDAQYFGLAQRRKRVFVVASARDGFDPGAVLFEFYGMRRDIAPSRETGQETAGNVGAGVKNAGSHGELDTGSPQTHAVAIAGTQNDAFRDATDNLAPTLRSGSGGGVVNQAVAIGAPKAGQGAAAGGIGFSEYLSPTLTSVESGSNRTPALLHETAVRRLTPIECERLQGFPDNYTQIKWRGKPAEECPDGHRYKALGNSMAVPCMAWIGKRIQNLIEEQSWRAE